jgi:hypothetical protein
MSNGHQQRFAWISETTAESLKQQNFEDAKEKARTPWNSK